MRPTERPMLQPSPEGREKQRVAWFIGLFLAATLLIPLRWYTGLAADERFSWRMFSANSLQRTRIEMWETVEVEGASVDRHLPMATIVQPAWSEFFYKYHQPMLVQKLLAEHLRQTEAERVRFVRTGIWSDGQPIEPFVLTLDRSGQ